MSAIHRAIALAVRHALDEMGAEEVEGVVERSAQVDFGDWSTPAPLRAARVLRRSPLQIAEELRERLVTNGVHGVREWNVTPPGYVNARLDEGLWAPAVIDAAMALDLSVPIAPPGGIPAGKTLIEHTGINTNKSAHLGHLRNACLGDTLARILRRTGQTVEVNNKIDDTGVQVADVVVGIRHLGYVADEGEPFDQFCSRVYAIVYRRYEEEPALLERRRSTLQEIEARHNETAAYVKSLASRVLDAQLATMGRFGIRYDLLSWESDVIELGFWRQAFGRLRDSGAITLAHAGKLAGCWILPAEGEADADGETAESATAKVLVKSDGVATYTAKDIAYQLWKFDLLGLDFRYRQWNAADPDAPATTTADGGGMAERTGFGRATRVVNVIDVRQTYPQAVVQQALRGLGHGTQADNSLHLAYAMVVLSPAAAAELGVPLEEGRTSYALSGRHGIEVRADDVLDRAVAHLAEKAADAATALALAVGAVRYYLLKFSLNQIITFDFDDALRTNGDTGVYLQYAHARAAGILRKVPDDDGPLQVPTTLDPTERALLHQLDEYGARLHEAAASLTPNELTAYAFGLASALSDFYEHTPPMVREENVAARRFRRRLVAATRATLADVLDTLGMEAPDRI